VADPEAANTEKKAIILYHNQASNPERRVDLKNVEIAARNEELQQLIKNTQLRRLNICLLSRSLVMTLDLHSNPVVAKIPVPHADQNA